MAKIDKYRSDLGKLIKQGESLYFSLASDSKLLSKQEKAKIKEGEIKLLNFMDEYER